MVVKAVVGMAAAVVEAAAAWVVVEAVVGKNMAAGVVAKAVVEMAVVAEECGRQRLGRRRR